MKIRIRKNKKTGETFVEYGAGYDIEKYRYRLLKNIIENVSSAMLIIDSNRKAWAGDLQQAEDFLKQSGIEYSAFPVKQNNMVFLGFEIPGKELNQKMIIMELSGRQFSRELYDICLKRYDIAIGIGRLKSFEEMCGILRTNLNEVLFNATFFKESVYDSVVCGTLRSSMEINRYIEDATNETAV